MHLLSGHEDWMAKNVVDGVNHAVVHNGGQWLLPEEVILMQQGSRVILPSIVYRVEVTPCVALLRIVCLQSGDLGGCIIAMTHPSTNKHIVAEIVARNQSLHPLIAHLAINVANNPAPVLLVIGVVLEVKSTCTLRNSHIVKLVEAVEEEANHHVTPAFLELRLLSSWKNPLVLVLRDQFLELMAILDDVLMN